MIYTTIWARQKTKTQEKWEQWLTSLKEGDRVLYQQFIKRGNSCFDNQVECWRFWDAKFYGNRVYYGKDMHPMKDGRAVYWDSDRLHGDVFGSRIVPWHSDVAHTDRDWVDSHAPVFEPQWEVDRCFVFSPNGHDFHRRHVTISGLFPTSYRRSVNDGELFTIFGDSDEVKQQVEGFGMYLYSEKTW